MQVCIFVREESVGCYLGSWVEMWGRRYFAGAGVYVHEGVDNVGELRGGNVGYDEVAGIDIL